ncbi:PREDICTED: growth-regulated alpha protein-like [Mandrillus leucophaeus]|uniref:C-X-C motif chemokine n=1 Tax=Mandrillus leucophaeus TaxID=9568 RepID=A0A2K5XGM3_MANLE|nr:PREDICTED: growth-regulated alpha protein-like [Mandrillus leucophaeus]
MACAAPHAVPGPPWLLRVALLLLVLLVATCRRAAGAPVVTELHCQCLQTLQGIHPKNIRNVNVTFPGPHCAQTEVIAALKNGQKVCLNPTAPMVQKIIQQMLNSGNANGPREKEKAYPQQFLKESILRGIKVKEEKQLAPGRTWTVFNVFNCFL